MTRTGIIVGGVVGIIAMLAIGLLLLQRNRIMERGIRRRVFSSQRDAAELATEMQRTDRITTVLRGTASPLAPDGAQTCMGVFVNGQLLLFDAGDEPRPPGAAVNAAQERHTRLVAARRGPQDAKNGSELDTDRDLCGREWIRAEDQVA
ncbi:MAG: hypothetical protein U9R72_12135, partial [Chloroflexota bacterium]|nr:hypothetical protein [Chloroflexota bacterium]